jgi:hypothetical protein
MVTKVCKKCKEEKEISMFAKYRYNGKLLHKATCRDCYKPNRQKYYKNNSSSIIFKNSTYKKQNRDAVNKRDRERRKNDIEFKLYEVVRSVVKVSIKRNQGNKNNLSTIKYLSYTIQELREHLEKQFETWMTWNNWGRYNSETWDDNDSSTWTWQIDHIIPQSDLPYSSIEDNNFKKCWSLNNLRPYSAKQNIIDGPSKIRHYKAA